MSRSTPAMDKEEIIRQLLRANRGQTYLEIGVDRGISFAQIEARTKYGIDPSPKVKLGLLERLRLMTGKRCSLSGGTLFRVTSDEFFAAYMPALDRKIDLGFVDGLHTYPQALRDCLNCIDHLGPNGVIVIHDCAPTSMAMAYPGESWRAINDLHLDGWTGEWCGDVWKVIVHLRSIRDDLQVHVIDCDYGVGVVYREANPERLAYTESQIQQMSYEDLSRNREALLNLKTPAELPGILEAIASRS